MRKKLYVTIFVLIILINSFSVVFAYDRPNLISESAILLDNETGKVLYDKNIDKKMYLASTTKIMTAILTLENANLTDLITVSYDAVMSIPDGYSTANLQIGEQLTVEQLLQLLLIHSANDAANVLAQHVGGSVDSFVSMMNTKVNELGLSNTHFTNTYGMDNENHYTTASDLAMIMKYCIKNDDFRKIAGSASCAIPTTNMYGTRLYNSTNELIIPSHRNYYPYLTAGKTGFTSLAGDCLVSCAYKDDLELICVILGGKTINGESTRFSETRTLYDYGFSSYSVKNILKSNDIITSIEIKNATKDTKNLNLLASTTINGLVNNETFDDNLTPEIVLKEDISAPIEQGQVLGSAKYLIEDIEYNVDLIAANDVEKSKILIWSIEIVCGIIIIIFVYKLFISKESSRTKKNI